MRMWMINPMILCQQHLNGEHGELHKFRPSFIKKHSMTGRLEKRQIFPSFMKERHDELAREIQNRRGNHNSPYEMPDISYLGEEGLIEVTKEDVEKNLVELTSKCEECGFRYFFLIYGGSKYEDFY